MLAYNIISAGGNNLNIALRAMNHMHIDLGFLLETKLSHDKYTKKCEGYTVYATQTTGHQGGVALFYRNSGNWTVEGIQRHGPNVLSCLLVSGNRRWKCIGLYVPPSDVTGETLNWFELATRDVTNHLIVFGDLNCNLACPHGSRGHDISFALSLLNLSNVAHHFPHPRGQWTWSQWREGRYIRSTTDYVLAQQPLEFTRWAIKTPRYNSDHRAIVVELTVNSRRQHLRYANSRRQFPIHPIRPLCRIDQKFEDLCTYCEQSNPVDHRDRSWIHQETWALIEQRANLARIHRTHHHADDEPIAKRTRSQTQDAADGRYRLMGTCRHDCAARFRKLSKDIRSGLRKDRKDRAARVGLQAQSFLNLGQVHEAFRTIQGWYKSFDSSPAKPSWVDLDKSCQEFSALYADHPVVGRNLLVNVTPYNIPDNIPDEKEIIEALHKLRKGRAAGPSGMKVESLLDWEKSNPTAWSLLLDIVQTSFAGHAIPLAYSRALLVLLPKGSEAHKFRGITLLEVLYKLWGMIVYRRVLRVIKFHPRIHGFCHRRGCDTAILEAKLEMQWAALHSKPYYQIFLDLAKAFDAVNRDRLLDILAGYVFGPNILRFLRRNWHNAFVVLRQMGYYGTPISSDCGIWQGDILSPLLLNIIVDCILRQDLAQLLRDLIEIFYADDGRLAGFDQAVLQQGLDSLLAFFARVGLLPNVVKTKAMVSSGQRYPDQMSAIAFKRRYDPSMPTHRARKLRKVQCPHCHCTMNDQHVPTHIRHVHHMIPDLSPDDHIAPPIPPPCKRRKTSHPPVSPAPSCHQVRLGSDILVCPVPACPTWTYDLHVFTRHLCIRHSSDHFDFVDAPDLTQCPSCGLFLTHFTPKHLRSQFCIHQTARRQKTLLHLQAIAAESNPFLIHGQPVEFVPQFRYLGRILSRDDNDDLAAFARLEKTQRVWGRFHVLLQANGASAVTMGRFYRTILQQTLLFGSSTWVISRAASNRLERFQARCARAMAHRHIQRRPNGTWIYPPTEEVLAACGLQPLEVYIQRRRTTLFQHYAQLSSGLYVKCLAEFPTRSGTWWQLAHSDR
jgi:hypothetical protein